MVAAACTHTDPRVNRDVPSSQYTSPFSDLEMQLRLLFPHTHNWLQPMHFRQQNNTPGQSMSQLTWTPCSRLVSPLKYRTSVTPHQNINGARFHANVILLWQSISSPTQLFPSFIRFSLLAQYELTAVLFPHCLPHTPTFLLYNICISTLLFPLLPLAKRPASQSNTLVW